MKDILRNPFSAISRRSGRPFDGTAIDLFVVAGFAVVVAVLLVVVEVTSPLVRAAVGIPLLVFVPGYVTVSLFLPRDTSSAGEIGTRTYTGTRTRTDTGANPMIARARAVSDLERVALSFGMSFALLPMLALVIAATPWGFAEPIVIGTVSGFSFVVAVLALVRRLSVSADERYRVSLGRRLETARTIIFETDSTVHAAVNVALVISMVLALTTLGYAFVAPQDGESYTSLQLLTENETGDFVASGYPETVEPGESIPLVVAVQNQEGQHTNYTVVVQEQRLEDGEVVDRTELRTIDYAVSDGGTAYGERNVTPDAEPGEVRISVQLYPRGEVPETPTHEDAYRYTYFWTDVSEDADEEDQE